MNAGVVVSNVAKKYKEINQPKEESDLFNFRRPHFEIRYNVVNELIHPVYIRDSFGIISRVPCINLPKFKELPKCVYVKMSNAEIHETRFQCNSIVQYRYFEINEKDLVKNGIIYLEEFGLHISRDRRSLENLRLHYSSQNSDPLVNNVNDILEQGKIFPITTLLNDPSETYSEVYTVINGQIFTIPVHHDTNIGENCIVRFSSPDEVVDQKVYHFETSTLLQNFNDCGMYLVEVDQYKLPLYKDLISARNKINADIKLEYSKAFGLSAEERKRIEGKYEDIIRNQEETINDLKRTNEKLSRERQMDATMMETIVRNNKQNFDHVKQNFEHENLHRNRIHSKDVHKLQLKKEDARVQKSDNDVKSSSIGRSTALVKAATVILPIVAAGIGYVTAKMGWLGVMGVNPISIPLAALTSLGLVGKSTSLLSCIAKPILSIFNKIWT